MMKDEQIAVKMRQRLKELQRQQPDKLPSGDVEWMLGLLDIVRMCDEVFTIDQIKEAFWKKFHKSGELWFDYFGDEEDCNRNTEFSWEDFKEGLLNSNIDEFCYWSYNEKDGFWLTSCECSFDASNFGCASVKICPNCKKEARVK